jgi:hypothetical protein
MPNKQTITATPIKPGAAYLVRHNGVEVIALAEDQISALRPFVERQLRLMKLTEAANV